MKNTRMRREIAFVSHSFCALETWREKKEKKRNLHLQARITLSSRLYRPISCQLTYKGTNCLSNLKGAAMMWREGSERALGVQNERCNKIEREKAAGVGKKKKRGRKKKRRRNERDERAEDRWFAYACSARRACVHAGWILIFTQPRHDIKGPVACHALPFAWRVSYIYIYICENSIDKKRDVKRTGDRSPRSIGVQRAWSVTHRLPAAINERAYARSREIDTLSLFPSRGGPRSQAARKVV